MGVIEGRYLHDLSPEERQRILASKVVFKAKRSAVDGTIEKLKARLVIRGDRAVAGLHYPEGLETPGSSFSTMRMLFGKSVIAPEPCRGYDICQAYVQSKTAEGFDVHMKTPACSRIYDEDGNEVIYLVRTNLYGMPSAAALHWKSVEKTPCREMWHDQLGWRQNSIHQIRRKS